MINLNITKFADRNYLFIGLSNRVKYTIRIENLGDESANLVRVVDILSKGAFIIPRTILINGCRENGQCCLGPISVGSIGPGESTVITMEVEVSSACPPVAIVNRAVVSYFDSQGNKFTVESNELVLPVVNLNVCLIKSVDKIVAKVGDIISYSVLVRNNSNLYINNVIFYDILPENLLLLPATVRINGVQQFVDDLSIGLDLETIAAGSNKVVSFQVEVLGLPKVSVITNVASADYSYTINDGEIPVTSIGESISNSVTTKVLHHIC